MKRFVALLYLVLIVLAWRIARLESHVSDLEHPSPKVVTEVPK